MTNDYQSAMSVLPLINKGRADDTQAWQSICIALKNCGVPYEVFENWSITSRHQDRNQIRRAWENLNGNHTIGTLCYYAKLDSGALPVQTYRQPDRFDGEKAFASIIQWQSAARSPTAPFQTESVCRIALLRHLRRCYGVGSYQKEK